MLLILNLLSTCVLLPAFIFAAEILAAVIIKDKKNWLHYRYCQHPVTTVLIPAHNEAEHICATISSIKPQLRFDRGDRLIVIADNCTDNTAELARSLFVEVEVLERENQSDRGKGFALEHALATTVRDKPPEVLVIIDGDCLVSPYAIRDLTVKAKVTCCPVQALYLMSQPANPSLHDKISTFALRVKNQVRLQGIAKAWGIGILTGSGMALPWEAIADLSFAGSKTTDDMQLTVDLMLSDLPVKLCPRAKVTGRLMSGSAALSQKSRWEHGHLEMIGAEVPRLIMHACSGGSFKSLLLASSLLVPPISFLVLFWLFVSMLNAIAFATVGSISVFSIIGLSIAGLSIFTGVTFSWLDIGKQDISLSELLSIPGYILSKLTIYLNFIKKPQTRWLKTERD